MPDETTSQDPKIALEILKMMQKELEKELAAEQARFLKPKQNYSILPPQPEQPTIEKEIKPQQPDNLNHEELKARIEFMKKLNELVVASEKVTKLAPKPGFFWGTWSAKPGYEAAKAQLSVLLNELLKDPQRHFDILLNKVKQHEAELNAGKNKEKYSVAIGDLQQRLSSTPRPPSKAVPNVPAQSQPTTVTPPIETNTNETTPTPRKSNKPV